MSKPMTTEQINATLKRIEADMAAAIQRETGAVVEAKIIGANRFSVFTLDSQRFSAVTALLAQIGTLEDTTTYTEDGEPTEHYAFFTHTS